MLLPSKKKCKEKQRLATQCKQYEDEHQQAPQVIHCQQQREEETLRRQAERKVAKASQTQGTRAPPPRKQPTVWRRSSVSPSRSGVDTPPWVGSPAPAAGKYRPGALSGSSGGWRAREAAKQQTSTAGDAIPVRSASPAPASPAPVRDEAPKDSDSFQTVEENVWRSSRLQVHSGPSTACRTASFLSRMVVVLALRLVYRFICTSVSTLRPASSHLLAMYNDQ